jgi:hypothetical protein
MALVTGSNGELRYNGTRIAKCREFSIDISRDALDSSVLGSYDRTFIEGMRGATGSATILYDEDDPATVALINNIFSNSREDQAFAMYLNTTSNKALSFNALTTQVSTPVRVGDVTACSVSFQVSGPIDGTF